MCYYDYHAFAFLPIVTTYIVSVSVILATEILVCTLLLLVVIFWWQFYFGVCHSCDLCYSCYQIFHQCRGTHFISFWCKKVNYSKLKLARESCGPYFTPTFSIRWNAAIADGANCFSGYLTFRFARLEYQHTFIGIKFTTYT